MPKLTALGDEAVEGPVPKLTALGGVAVATGVGPGVTRHPGEERQPLPPRGLFARAPCRSKGTSQTAGPNGTVQISTEGVEPAPALKATLAPEGRAEQAPAPKATPAPMSGGPCR